MDEPKIGVYVCNCGTNIAKVVDCDAVAAFALEQPGVEVAKSYKYMCSNPGQEMIVEDIKTHGLDRVVVAACSPRMHEPTFRKALATAEINPYFLEMANIREQCSWVHDDPAVATDKARALALAAIRRVAFHEPLERRSVEMCPNVLVIGGGVVGMTAAPAAASSLTSKELGVTSVTRTTIGGRTGANSRVQTTTGESYVFERTTVLHSSPTPEACPDSRRRPSAAATWTLTWTADGE